MKKKSVLFLQRSVPPDSSAVGRLLFEIGPALVSQGWNVGILATRIPTDAPLLEEKNGVQIYRVQTLPFTRKNLLLRAASLASVYPAFFLKALSLEKPDVLVSLTDPPLISVMGRLLGWWWKIPHLHWAQDVYPETAIELDVFRKGSFPARILQQIAHDTLRKASSVVVIGSCMKAVMLRIGVNRIHEIPNWTDLELIRPDEEGARAFRKKHGLENNFLISYIGNLGMAHHLEWFIEVGDSLAHKSPNARFVFIGGGPRKAWLEEQVRERKLTNILFVENVGRSELAAAYSSADIHITTLDTRLNGLVVPSKVYAALASKRPCIFIGPLESEAACVIRESHAGKSFSPGDKEGFLAFVRTCEESAEYRSKCGENARNAALNYTLENSTKLFGEEITRLTSPGKN